MSLLDAIERHALSYDSADHGRDHCEAVARVGLELAAVTGADPDVVRAFGLLHDSMRLNEWNDSDHGDRAADLAVLLRSEGDLDLTDRQMADLVHALSWHNSGLTSDNPTIGTCWDADRLQLPRVGITVDPVYLSTAAARERLALT